MNRKISFGAALALLLIVGAFVFSITMNYATSNFDKRVADLHKRENISRKYAEIDQVVRANYYGEIDEAKLTGSIASGYMAGIDDKYGRYISPEEYKKLQQGTESDEMVGIGAVIEVSPDDFYLQVMEVYPDSPAEVAGIKAGDLIIRIDDVELSRENSREMLDAIQGPQGSNISIVVRSGTTESLPLNMTRRAVPTPTVQYARMLEESAVGYLHISEFRERTYDQFNRELMNLMDAGANSLVIDLRDNDSDTLRSAARILDKLLPEGVLVSALNRDGSTEVLHTSDANAVDLPVVVLTNNRTGGVGELFAQSVKDYDWGRTVGTTTAGKGVMLDIFRLSDGSAIELSVAQYQSRSGYIWEGIGVRADFEIGMEQDWKTLVDVESTDVQLVKAKEVAISLVKTGSAGEGEKESSSAQEESSQEEGSGEPEASAPSVEEEGPSAEESEGEESGDEEEPLGEEEDGSQEESGSEDEDESDG